MKNEEEKEESTEHQLLHSLCNQILKSDNSIRFVGIPNNIGKLIVSKYRNDIVVPMLSEQEIEMLANYISDIPFNRKKGSVSSPL